LSGYTINSVMIGHLLSQQDSCCCKMQPVGFPQCILETNAFSRKLSAITHNTHLYNTS